MIYGLGTHFNGWVNPDKLRQVATRFNWARVDVQIIPSAEARRYIADVYAAGMKPLTIFDTHEQQEELPDGEWVEYQNEVNIGLGRPAPIAPNVYRDGVWRAYEIAQRKGQTLCAGAAANFERRDIDWFHKLDFASFPNDIICATHRYSPRNRFWMGHRIRKYEPWTWTRDYEIQVFREAIGLDRKWMITEFGYRNGPNPGDLTHDEAAAEIAQEWAFWKAQTNCLGAFLYQINDSPIDDHDFGVYDAEGKIKRTIFNTVPFRGEIVAEHVIRKKDLIQHPFKLGYYTARYQDGVFSLQPDKRVEVRPTGTHGAWETFFIDDDICVFDDVDGKVFGVALVNDGPAAL